MATVHISKDFERCPCPGKVRLRAVLPAVTGVLAAIGQQQAADSFRTVVSHVSGVRCAILSGEPCTLYTHAALLVQVCGQLSASSRRLTDFYELDINIRGFPSLVASLVCQFMKPSICW